MSLRWDWREHLTIARYAARWITIAAPASAIIGSACALFLWLLDVATRARFAHPWLLFLLPLGGVAIVVLYGAVGRDAARGNNLILDEIHEPGDAGVPARMAPLVLGATVLTHLLGGSAGREGTAVQIGGSVAAEVGRRLRMNRDDVRVLLMVGIAAGFGGVFGTPIAAAVFAMEVLVVGRMDYHAIWPCLIGGLVGDWGCQVWGIHHTAYHVAIGGPSFAWGTAVRVAIASIAFGLASVLFAELTHGLQSMWQRTIAREWARPMAGGLVVIALTYALGTRDYLGLGVTSPAGGVSIVSSFHAGGATPWSWWWKLLFTAITLSCGFKGGEVTPLFFIGAALGNALSGPMGVATDVMAALGFVAVFAGATNTPLACTLMGIELFGSDHAAYVAIACFVAYLASGKGGIYAGQRVVDRAPLPAGEAWVRTPSARRSAGRFAAGATRDKSRRCRIGDRRRWERRSIAASRSRPSRHCDGGRHDLRSGRRSLAGAWIETFRRQQAEVRSPRRSLAGAWIETTVARARRRRGCVAPSRERGLKLAGWRCHPGRHQVAPSRERGLKLLPRAARPHARRVAPSRERGLKPQRSRHRRLRDRVAPSRERGLKLAGLLQKGQGDQSLPRGSVD